MIVRPAVQGSITTDNSTLLDQIQSELPDETNIRLANEYTESRTENDDGTETLSARMTFVTGDQGIAAAQYLYERIQNHPLADGQDYQLRVYRTPEGGVTVDEVQVWYENNPDEQPTKDGETYIPSGFDPQHHIDMEKQ